MSGWQPIETAPKDGKQVLVGFEGQFGWVFYVADAFGSSTGNHMRFAKPTHWQPLPDPPAKIDALKDATNPRSD